MMNRTLGKHRCTAAVLAVACLYALPAMSHAGQPDADDAVTGLYGHILDGTGEEVATAFAKEPNIDTPRTGALHGKEAWVKFVTTEREWLKELGVDPKNIEVVKTTRNAKRIVHEIVLHTPNGKPLKQHKIAVVGDIDGTKVSALRVYYTYGSMTGDKKFLRPAVLSSDPAAIDQIKAPVRRYVDAIATSGQSAWKLFKPDGGFIGGSSMPLKGTGLVKFYAVLGAEPGGVPLRPATVTCDTSTCAIEENLASWGTIKFARDTAGLAVYDYDDKSGVLTEARVYDDLPDNPFTNQGWIYRNWDSISKAMVDAGCPLNYRPGASDPADKVRAAFFSAPCGS